MNSHDTSYKHSLLLSGDRKQRVSHLELTTFTHNHTPIQKPNSPEIADMREQHPSSMQPMKIKAQVMRNESALKSHTSAKKNGS